MYRGDRVWIMFVTYPHTDAVSQHGEGGDGVRGDVGVAVLEELQAHEDSEGVHVGGVELEVDLGGAEVVAGRHDPDHDEGQGHGVVDGEAVDHPGHQARLVGVPFDIMVSDRVAPLDASYTGSYCVPPASLCLLHPLLPLLGVLSEADDHRKEATKDDVANVTQDVVEHLKLPERLHTLEVVEANVIVSALPKRVCRSVIQL